LPLVAFNTVTPDEYYRVAYDIHVAFTLEGLEFRVQYVQTGD